MDDAQSLATVSDATFDGVVCALALVDIPDLAATLRTVHRILKPGGWFVFLITHPCFAAPHAHWYTEPDGSIAWAIRSYFNEGFYRAEEGGTLCKQVGAHHRTLATYLNSLIAAGFSITRIVEPQRMDVTETRNPGYSIVPLLLLVRGVKL